MIEEAKLCLQALGSAWRHDWFEFDGRTLRSQLNEIEKVLDGKMNYHEFCEANHIDPIRKVWSYHV